MTNEEAAKKIREFGLHHAIQDLPHSTLTVEAFGMAINELLDNRWILCSEDMPEEHDSIFKKFYGTNKWNKCMWLKNSDEVNVTSELKDGTRITEHACTNDGKWRFKSASVERKVIAWRPLPEPYNPELNYADADTAQCGLQSAT